MIARRQFLEYSAATGVAAAIWACTSRRMSAGSRSSHVIAGAIRWDAWYARKGSSLDAQRTLSVKAYYRRAPFFCSVSPSFELSCVGSIAEMDAEIHAAAGAGLKYWAFDWYAPDSSLRTAWNLYRKSPYRNLMNYCGLVGLDRLGSLPFRNGQWRANVREWAHYMGEQNYQKLSVVGEQRPLLYILWNESHLQPYFDDDVTNVRATIDYLRQSLFDLDLAPAYVVVLDGTAGAPIMREIGADAISNYISSFRRETRGRYIDLDGQTRDFWTKMAETGAPVVPIAMVGWDTRARQERPVPWEHGTPNPSPIQYYELPTPTEFSAHLGAAVDFIKMHPEVCPSQALLIYSWDECDEGGGLIPTLGDPKGSCLSAIRAVIDGRGR